jgi:hypothetical protein
MSNDLQSCTFYATVITCYFIVFCFMHPKHAMVNLVLEGFFLQKLHLRLQTTNNSTTLKALKMVHTHHLDLLWASQVLTYQ